MGHGFRSLTVAVLLIAPAVAHATSADCADTAPSPAGQRAAWTCRMVFEVTHGEVSRLAWCPSRATGLGWLGAEASGAGGVLYVKQCERDGVVAELGRIGVRGGAGGTATVPAGTAAGGGSGLSPSRSNTTQ